MKNKNEPLKVVFVDDEDKFLNKWRREFESGAGRTALELKPNNKDQTKSAVQALENAHQSARKAGKVVPVKGAALFNDADLVMIDYDLIELEDNATLSGEVIAYLLRCFTSCGFIVVLNPPGLGEQFFDLSLRRSLNSWADLVLGTDQLDNAWLWKDKPSAFAPWSWPCLLDAVERRKRQVACAQRGLKKSVLEILRMPEKASAAMDHVMSGPVSRKYRNSIQPYSMRDFVLKSDFGVYRRDRKAFKDADDKVIARIGAARLASWLEHVVLPAQSLLVDGPHLVSRLPGLLAGEPSKKASWSATTSRANEKVVKAIRASEIKGSRFSAADWLSRPAWYWPIIANHAKYFDWAQAERVADLVFCEDTSSFVKRSEAHQFIADVSPQFALRYVENPGSEYRPAVRLSM